MPSPDQTPTRGSLPGRPRRPKPAQQPARVARMLALSLQIRHAVDGGLVKDFADVARQLGVSRQRISTLVRLTFLAPDIQYEILGLTVARAYKKTKGEPVTEREVFDRVACHITWRDQRLAWQELRTGRDATGQDPLAGSSSAG